MSGSGHQGLWTEPKYPGDAVRILPLKRGNEMGDVRIQAYMPAMVRVAAFLPGRDIFLPGDTPKTEPEKCEWCENSFTADELFDTYVQEAYAAGWQNSSHATTRRMK
jgi:hypothetical protein